MNADNEPFVLHLHCDDVHDLDFLPHAKHWPYTTYWGWTYKTMKPKRSLWKRLFGKHAYPVPDPSTFAPFSDTAKAQVAWFNENAPGWKVVGINPTLDPIKDSAERRINCVVDILLPNKSAYLLYKLTWGGIR